MDCSTYVSRHTHPTLRAAIMALTGVAMLALRDFDPDLLRPARLPPADALAEPLEPLPQKPKASATLSGGGQLAVLPLDGWGRRRGPMTTWPFITMLGFICAVDAF